ncbi:hypothetical protein swp_2206 [Shewanella piezotolerans WP3]|uniref:Uncharacterized protein n=1 Tax=Shewanella piezotolerans (strain WP3 / JCM 13877) TaxID=225849 RepID=B8CM32_SHEPW|nr:hypothetical protein swp_2206 [Shewanella piezotolerans WP3]
MILHFNAIKKHLLSLLLLTNIEPNPLNLKD